MKKSLLIFIIAILGILSFSCNKQEEKKPFGAENIDYDKVEGINKDGPLIESVHVENAPPMADKTIVIENGPPKVEYPDAPVEPTADMDLEPDYGGIPVVKKPKD